MKRRLAGLAGSVVGGPFFGHDALSTMWAGIVLRQPRFDAVVVKPVTTWQLSHHAANLRLVHADAAICLTVIAGILLCHWTLR